MPKQYEVLSGLNYPPHGTGEPRRAEAGDVVDDLPAQSLAWLLEQGHVREAAPAPKTKGAA